jgi:hypothetical protein
MSTIAVAGGTGALERRVIERALAGRVTRHQIAELAFAAAGKQRARAA